MSKRIGNYVGFSTFLENAGGNKGVWNLIEQFYFRGKGEWKDFFATGGTITTAAGKTIHTFTSSGDFNVTNGPISAEFFIVAGGGGGGFDDAGGGGGGGVVHHPGLTVGPGPYTVTIGSGGAGSLSTPVKGSDGVDSSILFPTTYTAYRGGGGGSRSSSPGSTGGSGGGGGRLNGSAGPAAQPATNPGATEYGNAGGAGSQQGAGGGGAGNAGQDGSGAATGDGGWGGIGIQAPATFRDPTSAYGGSVPGTPGNAWGFAGGGGGGGNQPAEPPEFPKGGSYNGSQIPGGPYYGGGNGSNFSPRITTAGDTNTGGGGGAGRGAGSAINGANGGSGIVIIAYPTP